MRSTMALAFGEALELDLVSGGEAPPETGALVVAQDVHLILGEASGLGDLQPVRTPDQVATEGMRQRPRRRGSVLASPQRPGQPLLLQAIVYDFDDAPPTREAFVFEALMSAFEEAGTRRLTAMAVRPVGTSHAGITPERFLALLSQVCFTAVELGTSLRRVHLLLDSPAELAVYEALLRRLAPSA